MKRWLPIVAVAFLIAGCDNSSDERPVSPQVSGDASSSSSPATPAPSAPAQTTPRASAPAAPATSGSDSTTAQSQQTLTPQEERSAMPKTGQANDHSNEAMNTTPGATSGATSGATPGAAAAPAAAGSSGAAQPVSHDQALALMKKHNCASCHAVDKKLVGPSYKEVAAKYKGDPSAEGKLIDKVVKGGSGVWGPIPMPPHPTVPKDDIQAIVDWILAGAA